jgi:putative transcription factor
MDCEVCGRQDAKNIALVGGTRMRVCDKCAKLADKVLSRETVEVAKRPDYRVPKKEIDLVDNYADKIKSARERKGITRKEFALAINEREPYLHHIENGEMIPDETLAKKIERELGIKLLEEVEIEPAKAQQQKSSALTLGDLAELSKKKPKKD